ncbi:MAG TPA: hypothetical protein VF062_15625 [Candidatus Limnocylindrales bacterium]
MLSRAGKRLGLDEGAFFMHLVMLSLVAPDGGEAGVSPEVLVDLLWVHTHPADRIEHLRAIRAARGIDVSAFSARAGQAAPDEGLKNLVQRAIAATPMLSRWRIQ